MWKRIALAWTVALGAVAPAAAVDGEAARQVVADAYDKTISGAYFFLAADTERLSRDVGEFCRQPTPAGLKGVRWRFMSTVSSWSRAEMVRFGPATGNNRLERIMFWPDRRSTGLKQVQEVLATKDATATNPGTLVQKSVALQGLGALEYLLFGAGSDELAAGDAFRCSFAKSVAMLVERRTAEIDAAWSDGFAQAWKEPGPDNPQYKNPDESLTEVLNVLIHGLEMIRDVRLGAFLGDEAKDDRPKLAIWWRSEQTASSIRENIGFLHSLFRESGMERLLPQDEKWIAQSIEFEFTNADDALWPVNEPIADMLADPEQRSKLAYVRIVTSSLTELIGARLTAELGLTVGFSSLDGD